MYGIISDDPNNPMQLVYGAGSRPPRTNRGRSRLITLADYTSIDLETTGFDSIFDDIIEVAAVRVRGGVITEKYQSLIKPEGEIDKFITRLTGITNEMVADAPPRDEVLPQFIDFIGGDIVIAHNSKFDIHFIYDQYILYSGIEFQNDFIDTLRISRLMYREYKEHTLKNIIERLGVGGTVEHRALSDAVMVHKCYERMKKYAADSGISIEALKSQKKVLHAADIAATNTEFNEDTPIFGKTFVFTGTLANMARKDAMQIVVNMGGLCGDGVNKQTDYLVLGQQDYEKVRDGKSAKHKKADKMALEGHGIQVISEGVFYDMVADSED